MRLRMYKEVSVRIPRKNLERLFEVVTRGEKRRGGEINLVFTGDRQIRGLNRRFRNKDKVTDVLAFPMYDETDGDGGETYGEVYVAVPVARSQAEEYGVSLQEEFLRLACHGFLHLFGYDHQEDTEAATMRRREDRYLAAVTGK